MRKVVLLKGSVKISENWWESGDLNIGYAPDKQTNKQTLKQTVNFGIKTLTTVKGISVRFYVSLSSLLSFAHFLFASLILFFLLSDK